MPTIVQKRGWCVRIRYSQKAGNFVSYADDNPTGQKWFSTRKLAREYIREGRKHYTKGSFPVRATLTLKVEDR